MNIRRTAEMAYTNVLLQSWSGPVNDPTTGDPVNYIERTDIAAIGIVSTVYPPAIPADYNNHAPLV